MKTNTPVIYVKDSGIAVMARYISTNRVGHKVRWEDMGKSYRALGVNSENIFPMTNDGLNLAFERAATIRENVKNV